LRKNDRGKYHNAQATPLEYGDQRVADGVDGVELLEAYERGEIRIDEDGVWLYS